jgi:hypothetical protein
LIGKKTVGEYSEDIAQAFGTQIMAFTRDTAGGEQL